MKQLDDDRQELLAEKVRFETTARLNRPVESGISRTEIETAIKIAQVSQLSKFANIFPILTRRLLLKDAARQSDVERERFMEMQRQFEVKKRELVDLESNIRAKEAELERLKDHAFAREVPYANDYKGNVIHVFFLLEICRSSHKSNWCSPTKTKK